MTGRILKQSQGSNKSNNEELCVVCYRTVDIYSIGECDHPVCYICSTRMRVLCDTNECPICRKMIPKVVFTPYVRQFYTISTREMSSERKYAIFFEDEHVMRAYDALLEHLCPKCDRTQLFPNFAKLREHMRKIHELQYCDLCVSNLKIFTKERQCYSRSLLAHHNRKGDVDDKSHRGHPQCKFCDTRFMDNDDLFRHLRKDHYYCHFCDADADREKQQVFYDDYDELKEHFRRDHFLCEEGDCLRDAAFTSVFRTKLDLQGHIAENHSQNLSRQAARQARTVDIEFTVNHRSESDRGGRGRGRGRGGGVRRPPPRDLDEGRGSPLPPPPVPPSHSIDINCVQDFPSLNGAGPQGLGGASGTGANKSIAHKVAQQNRFTIRTSTAAVGEEEFPSLGSSTSVTVSTPSTPASPSTSLHFHVNTKKAAQGNQDRGGANVSIKYNHSAANASGPNGHSGHHIGPSSNIMLKSTSNKVKTLEEDFPSLSMVSQPKNQESYGWVPSNTDNHVSQIRSNIGTQKKREDFPSLGPTANAKKSFNERGSDFPTLVANSDSQQHMKNYHGRSSLTIPVSNAWTQSVEHVPMPAESGKSKKKRRNAQKNDFNSNSNTKVSSSKHMSKKKPLGLCNIFDESDEEGGPQVNFSAGRIGEYESFSAPVKNSNVNVITAESLNERKKSELNIGTLKSPVFESDTDFPSLDSFPTLNNNRPSGNSNKKSNNKNFNKVKNSSSATPHNKRNMSGPPGFRDTDMTFTSSSGEQFVISPTIDTTSPSTGFEETVTSESIATNVKFSQPFCPPPNFEIRNKSLIQTISNECAGDQNKFGSFKQLAIMLRNGDLHGRDYYTQCSEVIGRSTFHRILPELLGLLPDIKKQQEVLEAYRLVDGGRGCFSQFTVCRMCSQVLTQEDFTTHMLGHDQSDDEFPSLACVSSGMLK